MEHVDIQTNLVRPRQKTKVALRSTPKLQTKVSGGRTVKDRVVVSDMKNQLHY